MPKYLPEETRSTLIEPVAGTTVLQWQYELTEGEALNVYREREGIVTELAAGADFNITDEGNDQGGTLTLTAPTEDGDKYALVSFLEVSRTSQFNTNSRIPSQHFNEDADRLYRIAMENRREAKAALRMKQTGTDFDGQGKKISNLADGVATTDAATVGQIASVVEDAGAAAGAAAGQAAGASAGQTKALELIEAATITGIDGGGPETDYGPLALFQSLGFRMWYGTAAQWAAENPVLQQAEWGLETDTRRRKLGNGADAWADLPYDLSGQLLDVLSQLVPAAGKFPYFTAADAAALANISAFGLQLVNLADAPALKAMLGDVASAAALTVTTNNLTALTAAYNALIATNLLNQGMIGTGANQLVALDGTGKLPALDASQLINLPAGQAPTIGNSTIVQGMMKVTTGDVSGNFVNPGTEYVTVGRYAWDPAIETTGDITVEKDASTASSRWKFVGQAGSSYRIRWVSLDA